MAPRNTQSKWQKASAKITNLRWEIEDVLGAFTEEEKQSKRYRNLLETLDLLMEHTLHDFKESEIRILKKEIKKYRKKTSWFSFRTLGIGVLGGLLTEIAKWFIKLVAVLIGEAP